MQGKPKRGRPRTFDRQGTVARVMENYWQCGLHDLSLNELCRRSGLSKPALYREFGGEDGLLDAALEHYCEQVLAPAGAQLQADRPFLENIESLIEFATVPRGSIQGCLHVTMRGAQSRLGPQSAARVEAVVQGLRAGYASLFESAQRRGEVRSDITAQTAGEFMDIQVTTAFRLMESGESSDRVRDWTRLAMSALLPSRAD